MTRHESDAAIKWEPCEACRATGEWSDGHRCPSCGGSGEVKAAVKCEACGDTKIDCPTCGYGMDESPGAWVRGVPRDDLSEIHHAARMFAKYPGLDSEEVQKATRLADLAWAEICRRAVLASAA